MLVGSLGPAPRDIDLHPPRLLVAPIHSPVNGRTDALGPFFSAAIAFVAGAGRRHPFSRDGFAFHFRKAKV